MKFTLADIETLSLKNPDLSQELELLYRAINDYPKLDLDSFSKYITELKNIGLKSFDLDEIQKYQKSLSVINNAWDIESLESVISFCNKFKEDNFLNAVHKLEKKLN